MAPSTCSEDAGRAGLAFVSHHCLSLSSRCHICCSFLFSYHRVYSALYKCLIPHFHLTEMFASNPCSDESLRCDCHEDADSCCECQENLHPESLRPPMLAVIGTPVQTGSFLFVHIILLSHLQLKAGKTVELCRQYGHINISVDTSKPAYERIRKEGSFPAPPSMGSLQSRA